MHQARRRQSLPREGEDQQRHDDQTAADAEQPGEHAGDGADAEVPEGEGEQDGPYPWRRGSSPSA